MQLNWKLEYSLPGSEEVKTTGAEVPGAVQLDIASAEKYGPYAYAENWKDYLWMEDEYFTYRTEFPEPDIEKGEKLYFISKGIDYEFEIALNGKVLLHQEGMFTPVKIELTGLLDKTNELKVSIFPVPKMHKHPENRSQAAQSVKPAVSYSWDWHPRLIPSGIWDDTYLEIRPGTHLDDLFMNYVLDETLSTASIDLHITGEELNGKILQWQLIDAKGNIKIDKEIRPGNNNAVIDAELENPELWWTHDHGEPYLYQSVATLLDDQGNPIDRKETSVGFRRVRLVMSEGAWRGPEGFPKSRNVAPAQLELNGKRIFSKGTNWVNPEIFPGIITRERYNELTNRALNANFNMLRVWGGGIVNKQSFYDLCDEKGILVWQEFPLACNNYKGTPEYLAVLEQESGSIIKRLRRHPSLAIWSGGNELFNSWSRMTDQSLALRLLNSQCLELDPHTPYINTSPLEGMGHGHYVFRDMNTGEEVYSTMQRAHFTAYTEFGMPSPSSVEVLRSIIPENELWPPKPGTSWESHHAYKAWVGNTWLMQDMIEDYFGPSKALEELVENGQLIQVEGYKAIYEEARRQKPYCAMALNWCFNEPWPTAANNSLINYPNIAKPALKGVGDACRPVLASARIKKFKWREGEIFDTEVFMLNDRFSALPGGKIKIKLVAGEEEAVLMTWNYGEVPANDNLAGPTARGKLPHWKTDRFKLVLEVKDHPEYNSEYLLLYEPKHSTKQAAALMNQ
ncbi:MAG: hypothetical protein K9J30_05665 [Bacteroidales bacterium]|nr:hypothetical protein [Bacteroidales bacterium]